MNKVQGKLQPFTRTAKHRGMFERIFNPANSAEKWKGRIIIALLLIPATSFWFSTAYILLRIASGQSTHYEQATFACFAFGGCLLLVWGGFVARAKMYQLGAMPSSKKAKKVKGEHGDIPEYLSTPKVPFVDFVEQPDGRHQRQTRWLHSQEDVINLLENRSLTPNQVRLKIKEYQNYGTVKAYLEWRLSIEENAQASLQASQSTKMIEGARVGDSLDLTYVS
jgi:hypothetical protein